ncbi:AAA family ATPase [Pseudomonas syringae]|uniref:AAA family ATPase n=1 Tax=Pseudomonas syringae TaxID=317 RepID=UPI003F75950A
MKIKKVEVQAFRAYLEKSNGTFDFMVPCQDGVAVPANFVSLYAPNGFGKSSFYDAVEWAMTNGSERFTNSVYEAAARGSKLDNEALRILRNTEAPDDLGTEVTVSTTVQDFVRSPGVVRKDSIDVDFKEKKLAEGADAYRTIFLSQDAIDHFIRGVNPEIRYQEFTKEYGEETESLRREVQAVYLGIGDQIENCKNTEKKLSIELQSPIDNHLVEKFVVIAGEVREAGIPLTSLPEAVGDTNLDKLTEELVTSLSKTQHEVELLTAKELTLNELIEGLVYNTSDSEELSRLIATEQTLIGAIGNLAKRDALLQTQAEHTAKLNRVTEELRHHESVTAVSEKYRQLHEVKMVLDKEIKAESVSLKTLELKLQQLIVQRGELQNRLQDLQERKATWDVLRSGSDSIFKKIEKSAKDKLDLDDELKDASAKLASASSRLKEQARLLATIDQLPEDIFKLDVQDFALLDIEPDRYSELRAARSETTLIESRLANINLMIQDLETQSNAFGRLAAVAGEILAKHPGSNCPLCQKNHGSFRDLQDAIDSNGMLQGVLKEKSDQRTLELDNLERSQKVLSDMVSDINARKARKIKQLEADARVTTDEESVALRNNSLIESKLVSSKQELISNKATVLNLDREQLSAKIAREIEGFTTRIEISLSDLGALNKEIESIGPLQTTAISKFSYGKAELAKIDTDVDYVKVHAYLLENDLDLSGEIRDLEDLSAKLSSAAKDLRVLLDAADKFIINITKELESAGLPTETALIKNEIETCASRVTELRARIESYGSRYATLLGVSLVDYADHEERLRFANEDTLARKNSSDVIFAKLGELQALLDYIKPVISREVAERELESTVNRRAEYESLREQIAAELLVINATLARQLDSVFQTNLINEIYRKIDPHPNFSEVRFACGFGLKNKPTLNIMIKDKESEKEISPLLYFSAAQLNILSLSIFLARALNAKSPSGEPLDLILIDDPIHSMDSINVLSTIDLLRGIALNHDKQIVISTHDENFYELLKRKVPAGLCKSKFLRLKSFGRVEVDE